MTQRVANTPDNQWGSGLDDSAPISLDTDAVLGEPALLSRAALDALEQLLVVDEQGTLRTQLWRALVSDPRFDASDILLEVEAGVVTLRGEVESAAAKRAAGELAWETAGVVDVSNQLFIHSLRGV